MNESTLLQVLIQGGAVGIALFLAWIVYKLSANHISHNTESMKELTKVLAELKTLIKTHIKSNEEEN